MSTWQERTQAYLNNVARRRKRADLRAQLGDALLAWWDLSDQSTLFQEAAGTTPVAAASDPIGLLRDKSDNDPNYSQATAASRPLWQTDGTMLLDGTADCLDLASQPFPSGSAPCEVWAVVRQDALAADTGNRTIFAYGSGASLRIRNLRRVVVSGTNRLGIAIGDGAASQTASETTVDFSGVHVVRMAVGATQTRFWIDGVEATPLTVVPNTGSTRSRIGAADGAAPAAFWSGKIAMIAVTRALTEAQEAILEGYASSVASRIS